MRQEPEGFDAFWTFWREHKRHTDGRGKCRKEYQRQLNEGALAEDLLLAAKWHVRNTKDLAFIPLAATWLNSEAWIDECEKERAFQSRQTQQPRENVVQMARPASKSKWLEDWEKKRAQQ
jgi:hypothetical protein